MMIYSINIQGTSHRVCDDSVFVDRDSCFAALADGVSSAVKANVGSACLVNESHNYFTPDIRAQFKTAPVRELSKTLYNDFIFPALKAKSREAGCDTKDLSTTFQCAFDNGEYITVIHCGDGCILGIENTAQQNIIPLSMPDNDAVGRVYSADNAATRERARILNVDKRSFNAVILATDGFCEPFINQERRLFSFKNSPELANIKSDSDLCDFVKGMHIAAGVTDDISAVFIGINHDDENNSAAIISDYKPEPSHRLNDAAPTVTVNKKNTGITAIVAVIMLISVLFSGLLAFRYKEAIIQNRSNISEISSQVSVLNDKIVKLESETETTTERESVAVTKKQRKTKDKNEESTEAVSSERVSEPEVSTERITVNSNDE